MYEAFYGLRERPFNLTPDPKYLYLSEKHKEAFAHLLYGIKNRSGFVMITGEIGTGKTTLCRNLLNQLDSETEVAFIFNPFLNSVELMKKINHEFGIASDSDTLLSLTEELNVHLLNSAAHGKRCVLVIDEAQNLSPQVLEQIRLLSNLETDTEKLLQIILIGQPELAEKLQMRELRQLNQRITARYHLKPLNALETLQYIAYRIHVAGGRKRINFTKRAVKQAYKLSGGVPRMINAICDRALLIGYTREQHVINVRVVRKAMREIRGERVVAPKDKTSRWRRWLPAPSLAALLLLGVGLAWYMAGPLDRFAQELSLFNRLLSGNTPPEESGALGAGGSQVTAESVDGAREADRESFPPAGGALHLVMERLNAAGTVRTSEALAPILESLMPESALRGGMDALVSLWNRDLADSYPEDDSAAALITCFKQQGLDCEPLSPDLDQICAINLPGLARMHSGEKALWIALLRMDERGVTLLAEANKRVTVSYDEFNKHYAREMLVPWQDPAPDASIITSGQRGPSVLALKEQLRGLGRLDAENTNDVYDRETENAVRAIQTETGLSTDGKAGRQVRLALHSWQSSTPTLRPGGGQAPVIKQSGINQAGSKRNSPARDTLVVKSRPVPAARPVLKKPETEKPEPSFKSIEVADPDTTFMPPVEEPVLAATGNAVSPAQDASEEEDVPPETTAPGLFGQPGGLSETGEANAEKKAQQQALMEVRELPAILPGPQPDGREDRDATVTAPVLGSTPLVPHVPESAQ